MATAVSTVGAVNIAPSKLNGSGVGNSVPSSAFLGNSFKKVSSKVTRPRVSSGNFKIVAEVDEEKQTNKDKWKGLAFDTSDDQQDITRGKGMVDSLFQAPMGSGTHYAIMSSYDYISAGLRQWVGAKCHGLKSRNQSLQNWDKTVYHLPLSDPVIGH
ncbi:hypothetical protein L1049_008245 [Liquidambar formosana]|uniref:Uncharacterized protein n=1 Tax=Liquidambar formosana TaxID=63359 RepID=A0AAP0X4F9_LIQFO